MSRRLVKRGRQVAPLFLAILTLASLFIYSLRLLGWLPTFAPGSQKPENEFLAKVVEVPAADNLVLEDGRRIRLIGLDAPFPGQPGFEKARELIETALIGRSVRFEVCPAKPTDKKGRTLAFAFIDDQMIGRGLLQRGLAELYADHLCLGEYRTALWSDALSAFQENRGLWQRVSQKEIGAEQAADHLRRYRIVTAVIGEIERKKKLTVYRCAAGFNLVIFAEARKRFNQLLPDDDDELVGRAVTAFGRITDYDGPQLILQDPVQIIEIKSPNTLD